MGEQKSIIVDSDAQFKNGRPNFVRAVAVADSWWFHNAEKAVTNAADPDSSIMGQNQHVGNMTRGSNRKPFGGSYGHGCTHSRKD
jgi:hypothetical protein